MTAKPTARTVFLSHCSGAFVTATLMLFLLAGAAFADMSRFGGTFTGSAEVTRADGSTIKRDMSVEITERKKGFNVSWTSATYKSDGRIKEKSYSIDFLPSDRDGVFAAAMQKNVFGHQVQLDPMKGEPYVWARIVGDMLTVYSLYVAPNGGYEIQQFDRTLVDDGLMLDFKVLRNGHTLRTVSTFLARQ